MHYQVVAKSDETSGAWDYYPYWAPVREKSAAERLASYAAQSGYEAAILQSVTPQMLEYVAIRVVERQDTGLLPSLRYLPGAPAARANGSGRQKRAVETSFRPSPVLDPYAEGADKAELDARRLDAELGPGGDILQQRATARRHPTLPLRMDIISAWLRLREKVIIGTVGGESDGDGLADGDGAGDPRDAHVPSTEAPEKRA
jgi:hypothetical protein